MPGHLLELQGLTTIFETDRGVVRAVDEVSLHVDAGETLALVGESGSGKSVTALSILRLVPTPPGRHTAGRVLLEGRDLLTLPERELRRVRGDRIAMIFQEPMTSLNPVHSVGAQIVEAIRLHRDETRRGARLRAVELLTKVGIPAAAERFDAYPHQLSGGMRQRVMIAMALACEPSLLIADEPTTALDVTIQAQILDLLRRLQGDLGMAMLFITHDLGVVAELAHRVAVLYAGRVVEEASTRDLFAGPRHPYTRGLLASIPPLASSRGGPRPARLPTIEGVVPDLARLGAGCRFADRCALRASGAVDAARCESAEPALLPLGDGRSSRCHFAEAAS